MIYSVRPLRACENVKKCETEVHAFFICRLVRLLEVAALAGYWTHICGGFVFYTCTDHILFVCLMENVYNKTEGQLKTFFI